MEIGSLTGQIAIEDQFSSTFDLAINKVKEYAESFDGMVGTVSIGAGIAVAAIGGITAAVTALAVQGSKVEEVEAGFETLGGGAERTTAILEAMRAGVRGTVDDVTLMTNANKLMAAGVRGNAEDFGALTQAAMALSNIGMGPLDTIMAQIDRAMMTGNAARLGRIGLTVDLKTAEENYAESLGKTVAELDPAVLLEVKRAAIVQAARAEVAKLGDQQLTFAKQLEQIKTGVSNWVDQLSVALAKSPDMQNALNALKEGFRQAFGEDGRSIETITSAINMFARAITAATPYVVSFVQSVASLPDKVAVGALVLQGYSAEQAKSMIATLHATEAENAHATAVIKTAGAVAGHVLSIKEDSTALEANATKMAAFNASWRELNTLTAGLSATIGEINPKIVEEVSYYAGLGATVQTLKGAYPELSELQIKSITDFAAASDKTYTETQKREEDYYKAIGALSHDTVKTQIDEAYRAAQAEIDAIERTKVISLQDYDLIWGKARATADAIIQKTLEEDSYTREHYQKLVDEAKNAYDFALAHATSYTNTETQMLLDKYRTATQASMHWQQTAVEDMAKAKAATLDTAGAMDTLGTHIGSVVDKVTTLSGEVISLKEARDRLDAGSSITYNLTTQLGIDYFRQTNPGAAINVDDATLMALAKQGATIQELSSLGYIDFYAGLRKLYGAPAAVPSGVAASQLVTSQTSGGSTTIIHQSINPLLFDPSTVAKAARMLGDEMVRLRGGLRGNS